MYITIFGYILIPITAFIIYKKPFYLISLLIIFSIFQATSIINFPSINIGISPYLFITIIIFFSLVFQIFRNKLRFTYSVQIKSILLLLVVFLIFSLLSGFIFPLLFNGVRVISPKLGIESINSLVPLKLGLNNFSQSIYLFLNFILIIYFLVNVRSQRDINYLLKSIYYSGLIVVFFGFYQELAFKFNLPYPNSILYSNIGYAQGYDQLIGNNLKRINSTFLEPSIAGSFLSSFSVFLYFYYINTKKIVHLISMLSTLLVLWLTTSSTGYLTIVFFIIMYSIIKLFISFFKNKVHYKLFFAVGFLINLVLFLLFFSSTFKTMVYDILLNKVGSYSYNIRQSANIYSFEILKNTFGLGVGLGSNRPSGFYYYLLSNVGVLGTFLFLGIIVLLYLKSYKFSKSSVGSNQNIYLNGISWVFLCILFSKFIAIPDLNDQIFWVYFALLVSVLNLTKLDLAKIKD